MLIVYFLVGCFLRRWYGGLFQEEKYPILGNRALQTACMLIVFLSIYLTNPSAWQNWIMTIVVSCWLQFQFWSRGHGCCYDLSRGVVNAEIIKRYNERWYHVPCDWLFEKLGISDYRYGFLYDFIYMTLRYTCPMIPMMIFDWRYILIGLSITPIYAFCWTLYEKEPWLRPHNQAISSPTDWAEIAVGGVVFAGCYLLGWG